MKIEFLYIDGCPHAPDAVRVLSNALRQYGLTCPIVETMVEDHHMAVTMGFFGSPTIRINGLDIESSARQRTAFGMMCRTYEGSGGVPSEDLIRNAIIEATVASST